MKIPGTLLIAVILVVFSAGPAYPQKQEILRLQGDMIELKNQMKELQKSVDQKNEQLLNLVGKLADQTNLLNTNLQTIVDAVGSVRDGNTRTGTGMQALVTELKSKVDEVNQGFSGIRTQLANLSTKLTAMNTTAEPIAGPSDVIRPANVDYVTGSYDLAIDGYKEFLSKFPNDPPAPEARYALGDSYYKLKKYDLAIIEFDSVLQNYPKHDKTLSALFKKGLAQRDLGQTQDAINTFTRVVKEFPDTSEAVNAQQEILKLRPTPQRGTRGR